MHGVVAVALELGPLSHDETVHFYPSVFLANALAAFALNLVSFTRVDLKSFVLVSPLVCCAAACIWAVDTFILQCASSFLHSESSGLKLAYIAGCVPLDWED